MIFPHECLNPIGGDGLVAKSCLTLVTPRSVGSSVHGIFQARVLV